MDNSHKRSLRPWLFVLFSYLFISQTAICIVGMRLGSDGRADFRALYSAGFMIRTGEKHDLYNFDTEMKIQNRVVSHSATLPFIHPSGEALLFVPLSLFSYRSAYYLFAFVNFVLLILSAVLLRAELACLSNLWRPLPYAIFFCSLGLGFVLIQGQTQGIVLLFLCGSIWALRRERDYVAGLLLGFGMIRFEIALPIAVLVVAWRRWRLLYGFLLASAALFLVSLYLSGIPSTWSYLHLLASISSGLRAHSDQLRYEVFPAAMPNLRGLIYSLRIRGNIGLIVCIVASLFLLGLASTRRTSFPLAIAIATVVAYHGNVTDLALLTIPVAFALVHANNWIAWTCAISPILVSPFYLFLISHGLVPVLVVPTLCLTFVLFVQNRLPRSTDDTSC
jgi:Glycosyltransferase family 87